MQTAIAKDNQNDISKKYETAYAVTHATEIEIKKTFLSST